jgi:hypothetical protein
MLEHKAGRGVFSESMKPETARVAAARGDHLTQRVMKPGASGASRVLKDGLRAL